MAYYKDTSGNPTVDRTNDFYPFGLEFGGGGLNASNSISPNYTYSFQEQEKQQDTGWNSFKWRNYDPTMGRFFSIDPLSEKYNTWSVYSFSGNRVIDARELEGLEPYLLYNSRDDAAENFAQQYNGVSINLNVELGTTLYSQKKEGMTYYSYVLPQGQLNYDKNGNPMKGTSVLVDLPIPDGTTKEADAHTHAADMHGRDKNYLDDDNKMSSIDIDKARGNGDWSKRSIQYVVTPNGLLIIYDLNLDAPKERKKGIIKTKREIPSDL